MTDRDDALETWWTDLCTELGIDDPGTHVTDVLDLAAVAAHAVVRPAAPLTTFLVGYAAGLAGGGTDAVEAAARRATRLAGPSQDGAAGDGVAEGGADGDGAS